MWAPGRTRVPIEEGHEAAPKVIVALHLGSTLLQWYEGRPGGQVTVLV